jgi:holin-like protein
MAPGPGIGFAFPFEPMKALIAIVVQVAALFAINQAGYTAAAALRLPVPGNLLGMLFLLALLATGLVPLRWMESSSSVLIRHLAFFFIPITVGLRGFAELFVDNGPAILVTLIVSAGVGICVAGLSSQRLAARQARRTP